MKEIPKKPDTIQATPHQWQAMVEEGHPILVSASAGSGKTTVLIRRIMEKLKRGTHIDELLVVTYTEAAAKEMKERLRAALEKEINAETDESIKHHYIQQIFRLAHANISTIHAFCLTVIKRFFYLTNLDPVFSLMADGIEDALLKEKVWRRLQEQLLTSEEFKQLSRYYSNDRTDDGITSVLYQLYDFSRANPHPIKWLESLPAVYEGETSYADHPFVSAYISPKLSALLDTWNQKMIKLSERARASKCLDQAQVLEEDLLLGQHLLSLVEKKDFEEAYAYVYDLSFKKWKSAGKNAEEDVKEAIAVLKDQRDALKKEWQSIIDTYFWEHPTVQIQQLQQLHPHVQTLSQTAIAFYQAFQHEKIRLNKVDFSDLEHFTLEIVHTADENGCYVASDYYKKRFKEVLVDEYQDVNRVQEAILQAVSTEHNLFMVGDVKQSIYSFRQADPSLFLAKYVKFAHHDGGERILLAENFRSRKEILEFTNLLFKQLLNVSVGQMEYDDQAELIAGNTSYPPSEQAHVEVIALEKAKTLSEVEDEGETTSHIEKEIQFIAAKICSLVQEKFQVMDTHTHQMRAVEWRDIAILTPTKKDNTLISQVLEAFHIQAIVQKNDQYFKRTEITTVLAALKIIDNPYQDIPLVAVLRSGMVGLDEAALAYIRKEHRNKSFYEALLHFSKQESFEAEEYMTEADLQNVQSIVRQFLQKLTNWRNMANNYPIAQLIWKIYEDTHYLEFVQGLRSGEQRLLNVHALYQQAQQYEKASLRGLHQFVQFIETIQKKEKDLAEPVSVSNGENAVRVMTIHSSKGLEFPVVFMMNANKQFNAENQRKDVICSDVLGVGSKYFSEHPTISYPSIVYQTIQEEIRKKDISEELRKLYVAVTRARDKLFIIGTIDSAEAVQKDWDIVQADEQWVISDTVCLSKNNYLDWIFLSFARATMEDRHMTVFHRTNAQTLEVVSAENQLAFVSKYKNYVAVQEQEKLSLLSNEQEIQLATQAFQKMEQDYVFEVETMTANFQTVTELKRLFEEPDREKITEVHSNVYFSPSLSRPQFLVQADQPLSATQKGTAIHTIFQFIEYDQHITFEYVEQLINRLIDRQLLPSDIHSQIDIHIIVRFFESSFGKWLQTHADRIQRERPFSYVLPANELFQQTTASDDVLIHGMIDGYVELEDGIVLYDLKTDTASSTQKLVERYKGQLHVYARALELSTNKQVKKKVLCLLAMGENIVLEDKTDSYK